MGEWCIIRSGAEGGYASLQGGVQEAKPSQRAAPPSVPPGAPSRRRVRSAQVRASGHRSRPGPASAARPQRTPAGARRVQARSRAQPAAVTLAGPSGRSEMLSRAVPGGSRAWACLPAVVEGRAQAGCRARSCSPGRVETRAVAQAGQGSGAGEHMMAALAAARVHGSLNQRAERVTPGPPLIHDVTQQSPVLECHRFLAQVSALSVPIRAPSSRTNCRPNFYFVLENKTTARNWSNPSLCGEICCGAEFHCRAYELCASGTGPGTVKNPEQPLFWSKLPSPARELFSLRPAGPSKSPARRSAIFLRDISFCENEKFVPEAPLRLKERCGRRHTPRSCRQRAGGRARGRARGASIRVSAGAGRGAAARTRGGLQTMT